MKTTLNRGTPFGTSLHPCTSISGLYSYSSTLLCFSCTFLISSCTRSSPLISILTGSVLMNSPTIPSIPLNPPPLPDTVTPNTTSSCPLYRLITTPHAPSTTVFIVTCHFFAASSNPRLVSSLILTFFSSYSPSSLLPPLRSIPNSVGPSIPLSSSRQYFSAPLKSCSPNHPM